MQEMYPPISLGETAENVADKYGVTRERQDQFALRSHQLAAAARDAGRFDAEIVPVTTAKGEMTATRESRGTSPSRSWRARGRRSARAAR